MIKFLLLATLLIPIKNDGRYAQNDSWWQEQKVPDGANKGQSCCSVADGAFAEEEIEGDDYYVSFIAQDLPISHMLVPKSAIIYAPNKHGRAVVWYAMDNNLVYIRCFIAGSGI